MKFVVIAVELIEVIHWDLVFQFYAETNACLVRPASSHVFNRVPSTPQDKHRQSPGFHMLHALSVPFKSGVVVSKPVVGQRISTTLDNNSVRSELLSHFFNDLFKLTKFSYSFEQVKVGIVVNSTVERHVQGVVLAFSEPSVFNVPRAWEKIAVSVEGNCHYSVGAVKGFLHPVSMMNINIDVKHSVLILEKFQDSQNDIIYIAKPTCLHFLRMVQTP